MSLPEINATNFSFLVIFPPKRACLNTCRFAGVDSDKTETLERTDLNKTEQAVVKKTRTAREMKARTVQSSASAHPAHPLIRLRYRNSLSRFDGHPAAAAC